jgi:hypothetical protein
MISPILPTDPVTVIRDSITKLGGRRSFSSRRVLDVGQAGQIRAGRTLTVADFTTLLGVARPIGLFNFSAPAIATNLGTGPALTNIGSVAAGPGIDGLPTSAAVFNGPAQALYSTDIGSSPFRIGVGSWGCWFRTARRDAYQGLVSKFTQSNVSESYILQVTARSTLSAVAITQPTASQPAVATGTTFVSDDRWHHAVAVYDGTILRLYLDGALEATATAPLPGLLFAGPNPFAIGGEGTGATTNPLYGRVDEAFVTADVLSEDQVRLLYATKVAHTYTTFGPTTRTRVNVTRRVLGGALLATELTPTTATRMYNFTAGALTNTATGVATLTANGSTIVPVAGADGSLKGGQHLSGAHLGLSVTDAGLPAATAARSYGAWFRTRNTSAAQQTVLGWGTVNTADTRLVVVGGVLVAYNGADVTRTDSVVLGPVVADGDWHFAFVVEDPSAADGVKRKLYCDGGLVGGSNVLNSITLAGADRFRVGAGPDGTTPFTGAIDSATVYSVALTGDQVRTLYQKANFNLRPSPVDPGQHVEAIDQTNVYAIFDTLEAQDLIDLEISA